MQASDAVFICTFLLALALCAVPLGSYIAKVLSGTLAQKFDVLEQLESKLFSLLGIRTLQDTGWKQYARAVISFNALGVGVTMLVLMFQNCLPLNPQGLPGLSWHLAFNTAVSFVSNTNWQSYSGESTLSYFSQMLCMGVQNFLSAATGIAVMAAVARAFAKRETLGNFWRDMVRSTVYILLPLSIVFSIVFVSQGVVQTFDTYQTTHPNGANQQVIPLGPAASQIAIKQLGTNGGGFFGVNSAHPFENPTALSNFLECFALLLIAVALPFAFARLAERKEQAWAIVGAMTFLFLVMFCTSVYAELQSPQPLHTSYLLEGKEQRFGIVPSAVWATATTASSNGSVNAMHDSMMPISGLIQMLQMQLGEVIFGGVGSGMYGMLLFILIAVFISGLMVGRTPEYLGKKLEAKEITMVLIAILLPNACILLGSSIAAVTTAGTQGILNVGPHGLSEVLYAFSSAAGNNGSAFAGLAANTVFYNIALGICMLIGRYGVIIPVLIVAGSMNSKKFTPQSAGTLRTDSLLFTGLLVVVILIVGALTFFPALTLGPILEQSLLTTQRLF